MKLRFPLLAAAWLLCGAFASAADWPQFRGPKRDGLSEESGLLRSWPKGGPKLAWSFKNAGLGFSSFAIAGGKLYTLGTRGDDEVVLCLDALKGDELWVAQIGKIFTFSDNVWGDGPRGTPTIDGARLYAIGGQGILVCLDIGGGKPKEVWRKDLVKDLGGESMNSNGSWGFCESPLVDGPMVICTPGGDKGTLAALDKATGAVQWRSSELTHQAPYSSVMVMDAPGGRQYIQTSFASDTEGGFLNGIRAKDGKLLWSQKIVPGAIYDLAPSPIVKGNLVYQTTYVASQLFEVKDGKAKELYPPGKSRKVLKNNHGGVVLVGDAVYGYADRGWVCQDLKSGKEKWHEDNFAGQKSGSTIAADGMLYLYTDNGELGLAEATPGKFTLASSFTIPERSKFPKSRPSSRDSGVWAYPAIANGYLYLRDAELIFCYDIRDKK
jgi:outer membrane protein assembly factor BamB